MLRDNIGENRLFEVSCNRLEDHPTLVNLMWEKQNRPESFARIYKALTIDGFIRLKLTGKATANSLRARSLASRMIFDKISSTKNSLRKLVLIRKSCLTSSPVKSSLGMSTEAAAEETGLVPGIPVAAGSVDCNAGCGEAAQ